jgi:hypothetical protein
MNPSKWTWKDWYELARAAGFDAANANMRKAGRTRWNLADRNLCARTWNKLLDLHPGTIQP